MKQLLQLTALTLPTVANTGSFVQAVQTRGTYRYRVCNAGSTHCSNEVTLTF